jgi:hypothetical protein
MMYHLPLALITAHRAVQTHLNSALPGAPLVAEPTSAEARPRTYRTRTALATRLARVADVVAPKGMAPSHRPASSR